MRLHRLALTAFGPFGATQTVDFDRLTREGLFLLHGPTGAGKTSVLDAVCFALYGSVPGARQSGQALRSDLADPLTPTEVVLELTVAGRRLEITRLPEQPRPKKRGSGTTKEKAQSRLREFVPAAPGAAPAPEGAGPDGHWKALSRSHQEIGEEIGQLLGMSKEQFCQVVLLPQGDFARFLRADAEARSRLLGRLFDTRRFAALEEQLNARRKTAGETVLAGDERLLALAHRMAQAAGESADLADPSVPAPDREGRTAGRAPARGRAPVGGRGRATAAVLTQAATVPGQGGAVEPGGRGVARTGEEPAVPGPGEPGFVETVLVRAAVARVSARERLAVAHSALTAAETAEHTAAERWTVARERDRLQQRYADARQRAARLDERAEERERTRDRLERARAAAEVAPALALRDAARRELDTARHAERQARGPLPDRFAAAAGEQLAAQERAVREDLGSLAAARRAERRAADLAGERAALDREARADEQTLLDAAEWLAAWDEARTAHEQRIEAAREAATRAEQLGTRIAPARERAEAARRRDRLRGEVRAADEELLAARERATAAHEQWLTLKEERLRGIAAELADQLRDGEACAVCGATDHPDPARAGAGHVDRAAEEAAQEAHRQAEQDRAGTETACQSVKEALAAATAAAGDAATAELAAQIADWEAEHARAHAQGAGLHAEREALGHAEREAERRRGDQQQAERRAAARTSHREALDREQDSLERELARARGDSPSVADRAARLERQVALLAAAAEASRTAQACARRLDEAEAGLAEAASGAGFDTAEAAAQALLREGEWRTLQQRLDNWQAESAAVQAELADPQARAAAALPPADPAAAQGAHQAAAARLRTASATLAAAQERCAALDRLSARAEGDARELAPLRADHDRIARLAALASGTSAENARRMRLESYVLAARLEQVAAAASARLQRMSAGRYTLVHSDERAGGARRSGLGLHVIDSWTGHERDTSSLSGGETFFASLALALGLADVVTDEAGGVRLDTLFIDEGFGSLDEQTLDEVLDVLDSLRERDRSVGIVSHVADLRARIPAQLEVVKARSGSTVRHRVRG
ncbi:AAA family ATPase [Streptomyces kronopolitis]|uniref:AAA family ATPase n=1 Tax=Streptomyces kronopolitis TaxID=1612435 RepID=UPI0020BDCDB1|nr:SMC family ATPase [Streptomyces kronopolitis]MCL6299002.1 SMC family ATPase [Streptomyces kronopolitis]